LQEDLDRAPGVLSLLEMNGGNSSGIGIGCVSWDGSVHPDQFWRHVSFGNVRERPFSEIWSDTSHELLAGLRDRKKLLKGRCAACQWLNICNGNFRVRAEAVTGDDRRFRLVERIRHLPFPGGLLRTPTLVAAMGLLKLKDRLGW